MATDYSQMRRRRLADEISHDEYYRELAAYAGVSWLNGDPVFLREVAEALDAGDTHLNAIPLDRWDALTCFLPAVSHAFRDFGDQPSQAGFVCLTKRACADAAKLGDLGRVRAWFEKPYRGDREWVNIHPDTYHEKRNILPPIDLPGGVWAMGEVWKEDENGPIYYWFREDPRFNGKYQCRLGWLREMRHIHNG